MATQPSIPHSTPILPAPFATSQTPMTLITQGAEALLYRTTLLTPETHCALKVRPAKAWRHPVLDKRLTRQRILAETRVLVKCRKEGVPVPAVLALGGEEGWVGLEWVGGGSVKERLRGRSRKGEEGQEEVKGLMRSIGQAVGRLHSIGVIHGDLTTSNIMLRPTEGEGGGEIGDLEGEIVLIDFGLATQAVQEEDRAVDLYVLERAFGSTHPEEEKHFAEVLVGYGEAFKGAKGTLRRLEDVRMRGRKKSMIG